MDDVAALWQRYRATGNRATRDELILHYTKLVRYVVNRLALGLPPSLQQEDLIGYGILGLIEAVDRFNPEHGVQFSTYAVSRIRGQIIDSLRSMDLLPRSVYRHNRDIETAIAYLSQTLGRAPQDEEIAEYLQISMEQYQQWLNDTNFIVVSLDQSYVFDNGEQSDLYSSLEIPKCPPPINRWMTRK
jgi:RNA polymerase sigma factor for flagellar operon FliA